jgi:hypothetical protein
VPVSRSKASRRIAATVVASAAVMLAAACGGSSSGSTTTKANGTNAGGGNAAFTAYTDCLKKNGVTITLPSGQARVRPSGGPGGQPFPNGTPRARPSGSAGARRFPGGGGGGFFQKPAGVDDATWQKAQAACSSLLPSFGARGGGANSGANQAYFNCLKDHGVQTGQGQRLSSTDPAVKKALDACKVLRANPAPSATS